MQPNGHRRPRIPIAAITAITAITAIAPIATITAIALPLAPANALPHRAPERGVVAGTIDASHPAQRLEGFGAATAYYQNWIAAHPYKNEIYDALFKGLKLDILRLQNTYRPDKAPDFADHDVDIVRGANASLGHPISILLTSWAPPAPLKSNGSEKNGGTLATRNGGFVYDAFARYWADSLLAYRKQGIVPIYVSIQNEPDWKAEWESCLLKPTERTENGTPYAGYDRALSAVSAKLQSLSGPHPHLIGPEPTGIGNNNLERYVDPHNKSELNQLYALGFHLYNGGTEKSPDSFLPMLHGIRDAYPDKLKMQTEFGRGDMIETAWLIHNCLTEGDVSAYIFWSALWPNGEALIYMDNPWRKDSWKYSHGWQIRPPYWAIKHYSYFTAPGWRRVEAETGSPTVKLSAFLRPDRRALTAVLLNTSSSDPATVRLNFHNFSLRSGARSEVYLSTENAPWKSLGPLPAGRKVTLPPHSIMTVALH